MDGIKKTIVVVDDFQTNTIVIQNSLSQKGFNVITSNNPEEALLIFDGRKIDLLVSDFKMPRMNGAELTKKIKQNPNYRNLPILILSSETDPESHKAARESGAYGWLKKPFNLERFLKIVNTIFQ